MTDETDSAGLLHGYAEIGAFLGMTENQAQHRVLEGKVPIFKIGRIVCARRSTLTAWLDEQEAKARAAVKQGEAL